MSKIRKRPDGRWEARVELPRGPSGSRRRKSIFGKTRNEVSMKLARFHAEGPPAEDAENVTVADYLGRWLKSVEPRLERTTYVNYEQVLRLHVIPLIGRHRLDKLKPSQIAWLYDHHATNGVSAVNSRKAANTLAKALGDAVKLRLINVDPSASITKPRPKRKEMRCWSENELRRFLVAAKDNRYYALFVLAGATGMRMGELFGLRWGDVDFERGTVSIQRALKNVKGKVYFEDVKTASSRRTISAPLPAIAALNDHRRAMLAEGHIDATVFCDTKGGPIRRGNWRRRHFIKIRDAAEVTPISFHAIRHTAATLLLGKGVPVPVVAQLLGHSTPHVTLTTYAHAIPGQQEAASAAMTAIMAGG